MRIIEKIKLRLETFRASDILKDNVLRKINQFRKEPNNDPKENNIIGEAMEVDVLCNVSLRQIASELDIIIKL